jgi:hypothetical protein
VRVWTGLIWLRIAISGGSSVNILIKLMAALIGKFLDHLSVTISFSRRTLPHGVIRHSLICSYSLAHIL